MWSSTFWRGIPVINNVPYGVRPSSGAATLKLVKAAAGSRASLAFGACCARGRAHSDFAPKPAAIVLLLFAATLCLFPARAQDRTQARSMVITRYGIVATEHPIASQIGAMILGQGGSAADAAV